jgi:hypothetical protein
VDSILFEKEIFNVDDKELALAKIIVNGRPFIETVRDYELPYAMNHGQEDIAGGYIYVYANYLYALLTGKDKSDEYDDEIPILICQCGCEGCWDLLVSIKEEGSEIVWSDIHNPHRSSPTSAGGFWDYRLFPKLRFNKTEYSLALEVLRKIEE